MTDKEVVDKITLYVQTKELLKQLEVELKDILHNKVSEGYRHNELLRG